MLAGTSRYTDGANSSRHLPDVVHGKLRHAGARQVCVFQGEGLVRAQQRHSLHGAVVRGWQGGVGWVGGGGGGGGAEGGGGGTRRRWRVRLAEAAANAARTTSMSAEHGSQQPREKTAQYDVRSGANPCTHPPTATNHAPVMEVGSAEKVTHWLGGRPSLMAADRKRCAIVSMSSSAAGLAHTQRKRGASEHKAARSAAGCAMVSMPSSAAGLTIQHGGQEQRPASRRTSCRRLAAPAAVSIRPQATTPCAAGAGPAAAGAAPAAVSIRPQATTPCAAGAGPAAAGGAAAATRQPRPGGAHL